MDDIVVIGAGQAGASLVAKLRAQGFTGALTLIGDEPVLPYERPPLSKGYLLGQSNVEKLTLRPQSYYDDAQITVLTGTRVTAIDRERHLVVTDDAEIGYGQLALTTGSFARALSAEQGGGLKGVFTVRTLADVDAMRPGMHDKARVLVVGGGYIGLEAAAVASKLGCSVTLIEQGPRILGRVAAAETANYFRALHREHGIDMREGVGLDTLDGTDSVQSATLSDGTTLDVDCVIVGIGIDPATGLAEAAGLTVDNGIKTDALGQTSDPAIWSAGDCASFPFRDQRIRLESVQNAIDQAEAVAANMLGAAQPYKPFPWFWSDQYDCKLQIAGLCTGYDAVVTRGSGARMSVWYYRGDTLLAVDAMNDARSYMVGKRMLEVGVSPPAEAVADPSSNLKQLLKS